MAAPDVAARRRGRRTLALLALVCIAPVVASYVTYYWLRPTAQVNYGELLGARPAPEIAGVSLAGAPLRLADLRGTWVLLSADAAGCSAPCEGKLYATRQARTMQGPERERVVRLWLQPADAPAPTMLAQHPGLIVLRGEARQWDGLPGPGGATQNIYLLDPLGNLVLRYPANPDIKRLAKDLERLLRASRIG
jgi:hypothetical protein